MSASNIADWAGPLAQPALDTIYWYFDEIPNHTVEVGVADAEKKAAAERLAAAGTH